MCVNLLLNPPPLEVVFLQLRRYQPQVVVPEPVETTPDGKQKAVYIDTQTSVKVLNRQDSTPGGVGKALQNKARKSQLKPRGPYVASRHLFYTYNKWRFYLWSS